MMRQLRTAETEKYPHVTFFFNGGVEKPFDGEDRILIHSPKVATYDLKPEMSAHRADRFDVEKDRGGGLRCYHHELRQLRYGRAHRSIRGRQQAVETVDSCVGRIVEAVRRAGGVSMVTADHGNAEKMFEPNGGPFTAHTTFPVPFILVDDTYKGGLRQGGILADVAPTMLDYLGLAQPDGHDRPSLLTKH